MQKLNSAITHFFREQSFVIASTIDKSNTPHSSCKGIVQIKEEGLVYLLDLYQGVTFENLKNNPSMNISAVDEHKFEGYCLKGKAQILPSQALGEDVIKSWEQKVTARITQRVIKNLTGVKGQAYQPEALLPGPKYLIAMEVDEIVDLTPYHLKRKV